MIKRYNSLTFDGGSITHFEANASFKGDTNRCEAKEERETVCEVERNDVDLKLQTRLVEKFLSGRADRQEVVGKGYLIRLRQWVHLVLTCQ